MSHLGHVGLGRVQGFCPVSSPHSVRAMKMTSGQIVMRVDDITHVTDLGELAKLGSKFPGMITKIYQPDPDLSAYRVSFVRGDGYEDDDTFVDGMSEIANLLITWAYVNEASGEQALDVVRQIIESRHFPMDRPLQDTMEIGAGPDHPGH